MGDTFSMTGKRVLVSGAGTGIGAGVAAAFVESGADVVFHYSHDFDSPLDAVAEAKANGARVEAIKADFCAHDQILQLADQAQRFLGGVDVLINNSGITMNMPFHDTTAVQYDTLYAVNVRGMFFLTQAVTRGMVERGGGVVNNLSSVHAFEGMAEHSVYAGTKAAVMGMTRQLAVELAPKGVRVNAIAPGAIEVPNYYRGMPDYDREALAQCIPVGFVGMPRDIAQVALFLASDAARYIVGHTLLVDGGTTAWLPFSDGFGQPLSGKFGRGYVPGL